MRKYMIRYADGDYDFIKSPSLASLQSVLGQFRGISVSSDCRVFLFERGSAQVWADYLKPYLYLNR